MMRNAEFLDYYVDQGFLGGLALFVLVGLSAATIYAGVAELFLVRRWGPRAAHMSMLATAVSVVALVVALNLFHATALYLRSHRQGSDYDSFVSAAAVVFFSIYGVAFALSATFGALGASLSGAPRRRGAIATLVVTIAFASITYPAVEFGNACDVGRGFILKPSC